MSADLDDLLADRGRGPRTPLDLDAVHHGANRRGRRRRVGATAGLLAVVALGAVVVPALLPDARPPVIDQEPAPTPTPSTTSTPDSGPTEIDGLPVVDPSTLGGVVATALTSTDGAGGVRLVLVRPDGQREELGLAPGAGPAPGAAVVVTPDRRVTLSSSCANVPADGGDPGDDEPCVLTFEPDDPEPLRAQEVGFVIGTDTTGRALAVAEPLLPTALHLVDGAASQPVVTLPADQGGLLVSATHDPETGSTAAIVREPGGPERLLVVDADGDVVFATSPGDDATARLGPPIFRDGLVVVPSVDRDGSASLIGFELGADRTVGGLVPSMHAASLRGQRVVASSYLPEAGVAVLSLVDDATGAPALPLVVRFGAGPDGPTAGVTFARLGPASMDPGLPFTTGPTFLLPAGDAELPGDTTEPAGNAPALLDLDELAERYRVVVRRLVGELRLGDTRVANPELEDVGPDGATDRFVLRGADLELPSVTDTEGRPWATSVDGDLLVGGQGEGGQGGRQVLSAADGERWALLGVDAGGGVVAVRTQDVRPEEAVALADPVVVGPAGVERTLTGLVDLLERSPADAEVVEDEFLTDVDVVADGRVVVVSDSVHTRRVRVVAPDGTVTEPFAGSLSGGAAAPVVVDVVELDGRLVAATTVPGGEPAVASLLVVDRGEVVAIDVPLGVAPGVTAELLEASAVGRTRPDGTLAPSLLVLPYVTGEVGGPRRAVPPATGALVLDGDVLDDVLGSRAGGPIDQRDLSWAQVVDDVRSVRHAAPS